MHVALLTPADVAPYRALMLEAYAQAPDAFTSTAEERAAEPESYWLARIADPAGLGVAFGAYVDRQLVGTVALEFSRKPKTRHKALVIGMYVKPGARGAGVGGTLLQALLAHAAARDGLRMLTLTVTDGNAEALALYERAGFCRFGVEPMAILADGGFRAKVHMWLPLAGGRLSPPPPR
jgi:RimJ/RimL family protein N-acetyltransferase